jgi:hypothetical protein
MNILKFRFKLCIYIEKLHVGYVTNTIKGSHDSYAYFKSESFNTHLMVSVFFPDELFHYLFIHPAMSYKR